MIRIASVPAAHPFVEHIQPLDGASFTTLPEIFHEPGRWWPPQRLNAEWLRENADSYDLLHTHFGYESLSPDDIGAVTETLSELGKPLVVTVHDLQNPHLHDDSDHLLQIGSLICAAHEITTLTPGAASDIAGRWNRQATVISHPHVVPLDELPDEPATGTNVGVHLGDLRARVDIEPLIGDLREIAERAPLSIDVQTDAWGAAPSHLTRLLESLDAELLVHDRLPDAELFDAVRRTRVQVLPYRRGTHSGWLEMCLDLGVGVAAPHIGQLREQHAGHPLVAQYDASMPGSLARTVFHLLDVAAPSRDWQSFRLAQREQISEAYAEIYRSALGRSS